MHVNTKAFTESEPTVELNLAIFKVKRTINKKTKN